MEKSEQILRALAEIRKRQIISIKLNPATENIYSDAYVFAVAKSIYPLYHENQSLIYDKETILQNYPFYETYDISREQVEEISKLIRNGENGEPVTFYRLEGKLRDRSDWSKEWRDFRGDLIDVCRYFFLSNMFSDKWESFLSKAPSEANNAIFPYDSKNFINEIDLDL